MTLDTRTRQAGSAPLHFAGRASNPFRAVLQQIALWPLVRWYFHPFHVAGRKGLPPGPVVFVANHASHADTAAILRALPFRRRTNTRPAAAEDHFWRKEIVGAFVSLLTGAFPFPRRGRAGVDRAEQLLRRGHDVLLFPEGTRSCDDAVGRFHKGAALLAARGATIVPVGVAGTGRVLPKGAWRPRSAPVSVVFGPAVRAGDDADEVTAALQAEVEGLMKDAERALERPGRFARAATAARSRKALIALGLWAVAEALAWPVVPDFLLLPLVVLAPGRWRHLFAAALVGSLLGGTLSYAAGHVGAGRVLLDNAPLVTDRMVDVAGGHLREEGATGLLTQPLSGIPYKAFSYQAADSVGMTGFVVFSALARGARFLVVALLAALAGRWARPVCERFASHLLFLYVTGFVMGLLRVVEAWS